MKTDMPRFLAILSATVVVSACSSTSMNKSSATASEDMVSASEFAASQQRVSDLESQLENRDRELAQAQSYSSSSQSTSSDIDASLFPPNPKTGECYARVLLPAKYQTTSEQVMSRDAAERFEVIPARYEVVEETVLTKEASTKLEVIPAVYGEVQERVMTRPTSTKIVEVPAKYETVTERVMDKPAHTAWKKGPASTQSANVLSQATSDTGEIMCLVEVPATYKTIEKRVIAAPARTETIEIPAEYKSVSKTVVKTPSTTREVTIPAQYDTVKVTKLVSPASERRIEIPAEYQTISRTEKVTEERMEWRQVMCEVNMTRDNVMTLQKALADEGYYKASIDGIIGSQTLSAAQKYAVDSNLPAGTNYVPMEVVKSLKLRF